MWPIRHCGNAEEKDDDEEEEEETKNGKAVTVTLPTGVTRGPLEGTGRVSVNVQNRHPPKHASRLRALQENSSPSPLPPLSPPHQSRKKSFCSGLGMTLACTVLSRLAARGCARRIDASCADRNAAAATVRACGGGKLSCPETASENLRPASESAGCSSGTSIDTWSESSQTVYRTPYIEFRFIETPTSA